MLPRLRAVVLVLVGVVVGSTFPLLWEGAAEAGNIKQLCIGDGYVAHNPTDEQVSVQHEGLTPAGGSIGTSNSTIGPMNTKVVDTVTASVIYVTAPKVVRVLGRSDADTESQGYSECKKTK